MPARIAPDFAGKHTADSTPSLGCGLGPDAKLGRHMGHVEHLLAVMGILAAVSCGGHATERASVHESPPTSSDGGHDGGISDAAVFDGRVLPPGSGTRLTVLQMFPPEFPLIWDEEKQIACTPQRASDGTERCLPSSAPAAMYLDSSCTHAVVQPGPDACGALGKYFLDTGGGGQCPDRTTKVFVAGSRIQTPQELYPHNGSPCALLDRAETPIPTDEYYDAVLSDPTDWVLLTEEVVPVTDDLALVTWKGADGSQIPNELRLRSSGKVCSRYPLPGDLTPSQKSWCIPSLRAHQGDGFPNEQCSGQGLAASCGATEVIEGPELFQTGASVSPVYFKNPAESGKCMTLPSAWTSSPNPSVFYTYGPPLGLDEYPPLDVTREGTDRIRIDYLTSQGKNLIVEAFYDTTYGVPCSPTRLSDGTNWCVPAVLAFMPDSPYDFADPQCSRPVVIAPPPSAAPPSTTPERLPFVLVYPPGHSCNPKAEPTIHSAVEYKGPMFQLIGGQCYPGAVDPGSLIFEAGAPLDPSTVVAPIPAL